LRARAIHATIRGLAVGNDMTTFVARNTIILTSARAAAGMTSRARRPEDQLSAR